jgi:RES domain-containing protein
LTRYESDRLYRLARIVAIANEYLGGLAMNSRRGEHCLLLVPSVLAPNENNCLINPAHPDYR